MKNLTPVAKEIFYWDLIVNNKSLKYRTPLQAVRAAVINRIDEYNIHSVGCNLQRIPASMFVEPDIANLGSCYAKSKNLSSLKVEIIDAQDDSLKAECQYCNIGEPNTFDHYLPQVLFPEFSAISVNLVPCCSLCNTKKGESWLEHRNRTIISYYYDSLPVSEYLLCDIHYRNNIPIAEFQIDSNRIPVDIRNVVTSHYAKLRLLERYKLRSNSEIIEVMDAITPHVGTFSYTQIKTNLLNEALQMRQRKGHNYWRAVVRKALANSDAFLGQAGFTI